ncbi:MAG: hypothetical protein GY951_18535 [Psychromonas sp.]|nr:hypothetical protein [Psychromonas sp.]
MQQFKISKLLISCALVSSVISVNTLAEDANFDVGFTTVPEITITQTQQMDFGTGLGLASGVTCIMALTGDGTAATYPGDVALKTAKGTPLAAGANVGDISGTGCATLAAGGTYGLYEITGVAGGSINVTVNNNTTGTDFTFVATGCVANYVASSDGDSCDTFTPGSALTVRIADAGDTVGNTAGSGIPSPGNVLIAVGGTILTTSVHTAGQSLSEDFVIDVTY